MGLEFNGLVTFQKFNTLEPLQKKKNKKIHPFGHCLSFSLTSMLGPLSSMRIFINDVKSSAVEHFVKVAQRPWWRDLVHVDLFLVFFQVALTHGFSVLVLLTPGAE
jgi:hypothetical protein